MTFFMLRELFSTPRIRLVAVYGFCPSLELRLPRRTATYLVSDTLASSGTFRW